MTEAQLAESDYMHQAGMWLLERGARRPRLVVDNGDFGGIRSPGRAILTAIQGGKDATAQRN